MSLLLDLVAWATALVLLVPLAVLLVECWAALLLGRREGAEVNPADHEGERPSCAVLIPAHDEETGLAETLAAVRGQVRPGDRLVVVADNCSDRTADVARAGGAEVLERCDRARRGKSFALAFGVRHLAENPPAVVLILDADAHLGAGGLERMARLAGRSGRPVQAVSLVDSPGSGAAAVSAFAYRCKNLVRPLGLANLGLPCLLTGVGMAFPWPLLAVADLEHGDLVEDMRLGLDLALAGAPPLFDAHTVIRTALPTGRRAARTQRTRWEHGHLSTLLRRAPRLALAGLRRGRPGLLALALELSVPPLSLLLLLGLAGLLAVVGAWALGGSAVPALALAAGLGATLLTLFAVWLRQGRGDLPATALLTLPAYVVGKVPIYLAFLGRPQREWVRTERGKSIQDPVRG